MTEKTIVLEFHSEKKHSVRYQEKGEGKHSFYLSKDLLGQDRPKEISVKVEW